MRWTTNLLTILLTVLLGSCATTSPQQVSDFCALYRTVITQVNRDEIKKLSLATKQLVVTNDVKYRCLCGGWQDASCQTLPK